MNSYNLIEEKISESINAVKTYCEAENYNGWDPYDGLNSRLFQSFQLNKVKLFRLGWIQLFKRNPVNLRNLMLVKKGYNPKGLSLFLTGYCNLYKTTPNKDHLDRIVFIADKLLEMQSQGYSGACWGYNFDWQSRAFFLPKWTPTVVVTSFVANALIDAYKATKNSKYLDIATSSADFILNDLNRTKTKDGFVFSYSPFDQTQVYNASLLGSKLLARIYHYTKDQKLLLAAKGSVNACISAQQKNGSWMYGELEIQNWIDSFHTGYNLECISEYQKYSKDISFQENIDIGLDFYLENFFLKDGTPKYYHDKVYPNDIHCPAQLIVTLYHLNKLEKYKRLIDRVLKWTISNMQDKKGYFYYQKRKYWSIKIPYMRWSQAFMFYALSYYLLWNHKKHQNG